MEGISFRETACGLSLPPFHGSQLKSGVALENCPLLSSFSILVFPPFLSSPPFPVHSAGQHIFLPYHQEIASDRGSVASPLSSVHPILITMSNQWGSERRSRQAGDRFKIQFARRKQAAKMLVCPPELPIGRLTDKEVVGASERRSLEGGFARI